MKVIDNENEMHFKTYLKAWGKFIHIRNDRDEYKRL
jgi:hypothetical protein